MTEILEIYQAMQRIEAALDELRTDIKRVMAEHGMIDRTPRPELPPRLPDRSTDYC